MSLDVVESAVWVEFGLRQDLNRYAVSVQKDVVTRLAMCSEKSSCVGQSNCVRELDACFQL